MTDRGIMFSGPMVRALLAGTKLQTRRLATSPLRQVKPGDRLYVRESCWIWGRWRKDGLNKAGRQRWRFVISTPHTAIFDPNHPQIARKGTPREREMYWRRPSIHMPRWASRMTLIVTKNRTERLQEISEADAAAEGVERLDFEREDRDLSVCPACGGARLVNKLGANLGVIPDADCFDCDTHRKRYQHLWNHLHGTGSWDANPEVIAVSFTVHRYNIDQMPATASEAA